MEVVALAGLLGLGYAVTKLATPSGVDDTPISYKKGNASLREAFESAPQEMADTVRRVGHKFYSNRLETEKRAIV